jgi:hypothetical protein
MSLKAKLDEGLRLTTICEPPAAPGVVVPYSTLHGFCVAECGWCGDSTVRVADGKLAEECQIDFGRMGWDPAASRWRITYGRVPTAC